MNSLASLAAEYEGWRKSKGRRNEAIPEELLRKTRHAAKEFGAAAVQRATKVTPKQLASVGKLVGDGGTKQPQAVNCTVIDLPVTKPASIELLLPSGLLIRCQEVGPCLELIEALQHGAAREVTR